MAPTKKPKKKAAKKAVKKVTGKKKAAKKKVVKKKSLQKSSAMPRHAMAGRPGRNPEAHAYWRANLKVIAVLMSIWAVAGLLLSVIFVEDLNAFKVGGYPLGFWMAQQGSIYIFIILIYVYARWMEKIDDGHGLAMRRAD